MHPVRKRRLKVIALLFSVFALATSLVMYALRQNISLFYSPTQLMTQKVSANQLIRLGGLVVPGSVKRDFETLIVDFQITDNQETINVKYKGILPDLFKEGQSIVTQGHLLQGREFSAIEVLAKHDEKYMPPEIKGSLLSSNSTVNHKSGKG